MIAVVDSGSGNLRSVERALAQVGGDPVLTRDPDLVRKADRVVVPGQGAFADCMASMERSGLGQAVREAVRSGRPYLGICLGLQILFEDSEEHGPVAGLGILPGHVVRFPAGLPPERTATDLNSSLRGMTPWAPLKVPHIGWNQVSPAAERSEPLLRGIPASAHFYFIHSFYAVPGERGQIALTCDYGVPFCAAVRVDNLFACQFHPEKSQAVGLQLLSNFASSS